MKLAKGSGRILVAFFALAFVNAHAIVAGWYR